LILVTVGMHNQPFDRLVQAADELASLVEEPVVIQRGVSRYTPTFGQYFDFADEAQMRKWVSEARVVVSHGGAGSIISALQAGKSLVIVPRLKRFGEHFDDHQLELAEALAKVGRAIIVVVLSAEALREAIARASGWVHTETIGGGLQSRLRAWLSEQTVQPVRDGGGDMVASGGKDEGEEVVLYDPSTVTFK
jgi:beta-1,4-N-acetylglucosaminyltransferase